MTFPWSNEPYFIPPLLYMYFYNVISIPNRKGLQELGAPTFLTGIKMTSLFPLSSSFKINTNVYF